jgi:hypothetical protein
MKDDKDASRHPYSAAKRKSLHPSSLILPPFPRPYCRAIFFARRKASIAFLLSPFFS